MIYAFGANLFYANTSRFTEEVLQILEGAAPPVKWFAVNAAAVGDIDLSGAAAVRQIAAELGRHGATLVLCSVDPAVRRLLDAYGLTETIGEDRIFDDSRDVIDAYRKSTPTT